MTVNRKPTGTAVSYPAGLAAGVLAAAGATLLGAILAAKLIDANILRWDQSGYAVLAILMISSWTGAVTAAGKIKRRRMAVCLLSGVLYFLFLIIVTALFFGARYSGVGETALLILCGSMLGSFTVFGRKSRRNSGKMRLRNC